MATRKTVRGKAAKTSLPAKAARKKVAEAAQAAGAKPRAVKPKPTATKAVAAKPKPAAAKPKAAAAKPKAVAAKPKAAAAKPKAATALSRMAKAVSKVASAAKAVAQVAKDTLKGSTKKPAPSGDGGGIEVGARAPSFTLKDQSESVVDSASLAGAPYVLYFYPKDDTTGCTKEACGFRDAFKGFGKAKTRIIGVSPDSEASHGRFAKKYGLPFTLLSDPDKNLANAYGVWVKKSNYGREYMGILRSTFVVDAGGTVVKAYRGVKVDGHVPAVLEVARSL